MNSKLFSWSVLILLSIVWGSSFILMKRGMDAFTSDEVAALRIVIAFLFLLPFQLKHYKIDLKKYLPGILIMGIFGNLIPAFLFTKAETEISTSLTGMLNALVPLFTILVAWVWFKKKPTQNQIVGIIVGFIAAVCLMLFASSEDVFRNFIYSLLVVAATFCYAMGLNGIGHYLGDINSAKATTWSFTFIGPVAMVYLFGFTDFTQHLHQSPLALPSLGYVAILAIIGTALSVMLYAVLIGRAGTVFASSTTYLIPVVAIGWGLLFGETINMKQVLSIVAIIFSVYLINRR